VVLSRPWRLACALALSVVLCAGAAAAASTPPRASGKQKPPSVSNYVVRATDSDNLQLDAPALPDLSGYTDAAIEAKIVRKPLGRVAVRRMVQDITLHEFVGGGGRLAEWAARQSTNPVAITLERGYMTPRDLARALPARYFEQTAPGVFMLRLPLVVAAGATLHIGPEVKDFRMSQERGGFLVNNGMLFLSGSRLSAWRERENRPAEFRKPSEFRPFLISWGGSQTYISRSVVTGLGYDASKAYGISISQYSPHMDARIHAKRPTGWILNSEFSENWYGFYCYEADDVAVIGNRYRDNIVYGIDPHDRSRRLIIAHNIASGVRMKHGIIISREVNDSWIFNNRAFGNHLAGIVIDRNSTHNIVAYNEVTGNDGDGITIYESPSNLLWANRSVGNRRHGIRLRNSVDVRLYHNAAVANGLAGIYGHIKDLSGTDRDLKLDPFELGFSMVVVGGELIFNRSGPVTLDRPLSAELYNVELLAPVRRAGMQMTGVLGDHQSQVLDILVRQKRAVVVEPADKKQMTAER